MTFSKETRPEQQSSFPRVQTEIDSDTLVELLRGEYQSDNYQVFAEHLKETGLLAELEHAGIVPVEDNEKRELVLRSLYVGAMLNNVYNGYLASIRSRSVNQSLSKSQIPKTPELFEQSELDEDVLDIPILFGTGCFVSYKLAAPSDFSQQPESE